MSNSQDCLDAFAAAEFALLRAALVSAYLRVTGDDPEVLALSVIVRRGDCGQFDIDLEFLGQAGFAVGGMTV